MEYYKEKKKTSKKEGRSGMLHRQQAALTTTEAYSAPVPGRRHNTARRVFKIKTASTAPL